MVQRRRKQLSVLVAGQALTSAVVLGLVCPHIVGWVLILIVDIVSALFLLVYDGHAWLAWRIFAVLLVAKDHAISILHAVCRGTHLVHDCLAFILRWLGMRHLLLLDLTRVVFQFHFLNIL